MRIFYFFSILLAGMLIAHSPSFAASTFEEALNAYNNKNYSKAAELFLDEANRGNAQAQCNLGFMYNNGQGVPQDYKEALKWYRLAAEQGNAQAQGNLGLMYVMGQGVPEDFIEAYAWFAVSAVKGNVNSRDNMDQIIQNMTPYQIEKAQELAKEYLARTGK